MPVMQCPGCGGWLEVPADGAERRVAQCGENKLPVPDVNVGYSAQAVAELQQTWKLEAEENSTPEDKNG